MEISARKLQEHIGVGGKYAKHIHMYDMDSDEDTDYIAVCRHYILCMPKETITVNPEINKVKLVAAVNAMAQGAVQELTYHSTVETTNPKRQCMFVNEEGEKIYVNKSFFTDFINGAYSDKTGFAKGITFTGSTFKSPVCMWYGDDLVGVFLPIIHRA